MTITETLDLEQRLSRRHGNNPHCRRRDCAVQLQDDSQLGEGRNLTNYGTVTQTGSGQIGDYPEWDDDHHECCRR